MLIRIMSELGENICNRDDLQVPPGCSIISAPFSLVLNQDGELTDILVIKKEDMKTISPLAVINGRFSSATGKDLLPDLVFPRKKFLFDKTLKDIYVSNLKAANLILQDKRIETILKFLDKPLDTAVFNNVRDTDYLKFIIIDETGTKTDISTDYALMKSCGLYILDTLISHFADSALICDVTGRTTKHLVISAGKLMNGTVTGTRAISSSCYNDYYHGDYEKDNFVSCIGLETEFYFITAYYNTSRKYYSKYYKRCFYFGSTDGDIQFPIIPAMPFMSKQFDFPISNMGDYKNLQELILNKCYKKDFLLFEYDWVNKGRISTYHAERYSSEEAKMLIQNIFKWIELASITDDDGVIHTFSAIDYIEFHHYTENAIKANVLISDFFYNVLNGKYLTIVNQYIKPVLNMNVNPSYKKRLYRMLIQIYRKVYENDMNTETVEYKAGLLFAEAVLLERKYYRDNPSANNTYLVENMLDKYLLNPFNTWIKIRTILIKYTKSKPNWYRENMSRITHLTWELTHFYSFDKARNLNGIALIAYDEALEDFYHNRSIRKDEETDEKL